MSKIFAKNFQNSTNLVTLSINPLRQFHWKRNKGTKSLSLFYTLAVWPDLSKFRYFGKILKVWGKKWVPIWYCCVNSSYSNVTFILYSVSHSLDFYIFLFPSGFFLWHKITTLLLLQHTYNVLDTSFPWHLLTLHIRFENVHCYCIILNDMKYSISSLKAFVHRVATIHKSIWQKYLTNFGHFYAFWPIFIFVNDQTGTNHLVTLHTGSQNIHR